jgi:hypothetical protein
MDSKKRTQILYDDPNSMFKSGKKIYLHELLGATLKTTKPSPNQLEQELKTSNLVVELIQKLNSISSYVYYLDGLFQQNYMISTPFLLQNLKESINYITSIVNVIKKLLKVPQNSLNPDDVITINQLYANIKDKIEEINIQLRDTPVEFIDPVFLSSSFKSFDNKLIVLYRELDKLIPFMSVQGLPSDNIISAGLPGQLITEPPLQQQDLVDLEPAPPLELEGAGRFKVLSGRIRKQQQHNFKRFL